MSTNIHPTAIVEPGAQLGVDCEIQAYAVIHRYAQLGDGVVVCPHATLGGDPQYLRFDRRMETFVRIGAGTVVRENVTINRSTHEGGATSVGKNCFLMAGMHIAHDCVLGDQVVVANNALLAGHVVVGDFSFVGGGAAVHQFVRIGESAMIGGVARIGRDVPPYLLVAEREEISGLNLVGLKRRGFSRESIAELKQLFRTVFYTTGNIRVIASDLLAGGTAKTPEGRRFLEFFTEGKRSFCRPSRRSAEEVPDET